MELKIKFSPYAAFSFLKILKKLNINLSDLAENFVGSEKITSENIGDKQEELGQKMFDVLINGLGKVEEDVHSFLKDALNLGDEEYKQIDLFIDLLPALESYPGWTHFFKLVSRLEAKIK